MLMLLLQACGGDGGGEGPSQSNRPPVASASGPNLAIVGSRIVFDGRASTDPDGDVLGYQWTIVRWGSGSRAQLAQATSAEAVLVPDVVGIYIVELVVRDGESASEPVRVTVEVQASGDPQIVVNAPEPLEGRVRLDLDRAVPVQVSWLVDGIFLGVGTFNSAIDWNTKLVANGPHVVAARIHSTTGTQEVRRTVEVYNSPIEMEVATQSFNAELSIVVRAQSPNVVDSVQATLDGRDLGTLTAPNACLSANCSGSASALYRFTATGLVSATHTLVVTADDGVVTRRITRDVLISNAPVLTVATPIEGAFVFGSLTVSGTASTDKSGGLTVSASLDNQQILRTTEPSFSATASLAGLQPGLHFVAVRATDRDGVNTILRRSVVLASSSALAYSPSVVMPAGGRLLAADGNQALYRPNVAGEIDPVIVRDLVSSSELSLGPIGSDVGSDWQLTGGRVYAQMRASDCPSTCIYQWGQDGSRTNLTTSNPLYAGLTRQLSDFDEHPVSRDGYVVWAAWRQLGGYILYEAATGTYRHIPKPPEAGYVGNHLYEVAVAGGVVRFVFWAQTGGSGTSSTFDVYQWDSVSGASTRLTSGTQQDIYPQTDGLRAAWQRQPVGGSVDGRFTLMAQPLAGGGATALSSSVISFKLRDGVLAWLERTPNFEYTLRASTASGVTTIASGLGLGLWSAGGGFVIYSDGAKTYAWNAATGQASLKIDAVPAEQFVAGGALVFRIGSAIYRVSL
ncbi:MAG TPA: PKD domain-containing protein [Ramlibacter sp.]|nr:PKD domain-containing protein [Ramlibacter sp.]